ncbi:MAG: porin [Caldimonas sp.]
MIRSIVVVSIVAAAAICSPPAQAQSLLYGLVDAAASRSRPPGGDYRYQLDNGDMSRSFIGFRGSEDLGGGLRGVFKLESYLRIDSGESGRYTGDGFWGRDSNVGLSGAFGTTVLGRTVTPFYLATVSFNPFGDSFAFSPSARQYYMGTLVGDRSWNNSMSYSNNATDSPLRINLAANTPEEAIGAPNTGRNYGGSVAYISGPFAATVAIERVKNTPLPVPVEFRRQLAIQAAASYDFQFMRLYGQVGRVKTDAASDTRTVLYQIGAAIPVGNGLILASFGSSRAGTPISQITDRTGSIGYDYFLSKSTDIYVAAMREKTFMLSAGGTIAGGVRMRF